MPEEQSVSSRLLKRVKRPFVDYYGLTLLGLLTMIAIGIVGLVALLGVGMYYGERADCAAFGRQSGRDVRFVHLVDPGVPLSWDCLVRTADGRWISRSQLRSVDES